MSWSGTTTSRRIAIGPSDELNTWSGERLVAVEISRSHLRQTGGSDVAVVHPAGHRDEHPRNVGAARVEAEELDMISGVDFKGTPNPGDDVRPRDGRQTLAVGT